MDMEALIESGRGCYARRKYERALKQFTRAMNRCPCNRGTKRKRCTCKNYEAVADRDGSMFEEAMFTCHCDVGKAFDKCDDALHIMALDYRAATFEAMDELERAEKDAKWMLELAPRLPDGYLRLGKNARLRRDAWFAWKIYSAGVDANKHTPLSSSRKLQQLHQALQPLQVRFRRKDPMCLLPLEIVHNIVEDFDVVELTKCLRVCKVWKQTLESSHSQRLWRFLVFPKPPPQPPSKSALQALVRRSGGSMRRIVIRDPGKFQLSQAKLSTLLRHSQSLEHLELGPAHEHYYRFPEGPGLYQNLCHLTMDTYNCWERNMWQSQGPYPLGPGFLPDAFLKCVAGTLEYLNLFGIPPSWCGRRNLPEFPRLKILRLEHKEGLEPQVSFPIFSLACKTPQLEQLRLENLHLAGHTSQECRDSWHTLWTGLKVLVFLMPRSSISPLQLVDTFFNVTLLNSVQAGKNFEHLDLEVPVDNVDAVLPQQVFSDADDLDLYGLTKPDGSPIRRRNQFQNLRSLRLKHFVHRPKKMGKIFAAAVASGKLHTFDIVFPVESLDLPLGEESANFLKGYDWLRGLDSIRSLGVSDFAFPEVPHRDSEPPLPSFLASFPNLKTLSLSTNSCNQEAFCLIVEETMKRTRLSTMYQNCVKGTLMDRLKRLGDRHGVVVIFGTRPRDWPVQLDGEELSST
ncbi:tetratricopeptide-like helical [Hirsutella rhossiliensis]|uniref:Tetratricopeptide-like helical n=1 Tax=Hirsutella rhossiliensis TaxID=111463 RepID=A0A9P8N4V9_9HYPO|nr:Tetratricopeptide-like helical [Hirsutella rhossiliensis]KAH0967663.1 Tetratricopeptide-like helical [Hirsutella rhossiliensis]